MSKRAKDIAICRPSWTQIGIDIDGEDAGDSLGRSVSISNDGTVIATGAPYNEGNGDRSGHVRVYEWDDAIDAWLKRGEDIDGNTACDYSGYSVSISNDGAVVAIGSYGNAGNGDYSGHVRVYEWDDITSVWLKRDEEIDGEAAGDGSGYSLSMSHDGAVVAIGATGNDGNGINSGHVRVYEWDDKTRVWLKRGIDIDGEGADDYSGRSVSLSNDGAVVAIGAEYNDGNGDISGHVRVYEWDTAEIRWFKRGRDIDGEAAGDLSGSSVSLSNDGAIVAIGATGNEANGYCSGHVRIYIWDDNTRIWSKRGEDIDGEAAGDKSGRSVSLSSDGSILAVGAYTNDGNGIKSGHVRVYEWAEISSGWLQRGKDIDGEAAGDSSGVSVSLSNDGTVVAIGALYNDGNGTSSGHVRVMKWKTTYQCTDSPLRFKILRNGGLTTRSCIWVARSNTKIRCALKGIRQTCPSTCMTCSICADSPLRIKFDFKGAYVAKSCKWAARKNVKARCIITGMADTCRATCDYHA